VEEIEWHSSAVSLSLHFYSCKETFGISKIYVSVILFLLYCILLFWKIEKFCNCIIRLVPIVVIKFVPYMRWNILVQ
jgi:Na+/alanine symporter